MELRPEVKAFAEEMEKQLRANEDKGGWKNSPTHLLMEGLRRNHELLKGTHIHDTKKITRRCANIANFAMMVVDNLEGLNY